MFPFKKYYNKILTILIFVIYIFIIYEKLNQNIINKQKGNLKMRNKIFSQNKFNKCYSLLDYSNIRIIHLIFTRFLIPFYKYDGFPEKIYKKDYISNGIRVMNRYLFASLDNQSCKNFIWVLMLGDKANITLVKMLLSFNTSFVKKIIYQKDIKNYVRNITKGFDVLITSRIDYDDIIYYDAVNDLRKAININNPMILYGFNRGIIYFESEEKSYEFWYKNQNGCWSVFASLITNLKKVNDSYTILDLGSHTHLRRNLLGNFKLFGIKEINYEPAIFDNGDIKFAYVRQKYSGSFFINGKINKTINAYNFNLNKLYGI